MTQTVLIKRSTVANAVPPALAVGELAANVADDPIKVWVGTPAGVRRLFEAEAIEDAENDTVYGRCNGDWVPMPAVAAEPPTDPAPNTLWWDSSDGRLYLYFKAQWVEIDRG